jgi:hypothetical protein
MTFQITPENTQNKSALIDWQNDLLSTTVSDLQKSNLMGYLQW